MRVKEVWILVLVLLSSFVIAAPNADITLTPLTLYETTQADFNLTIDNLFKDEVIEKIQLIMPAAEITDVTDFYGWQNNFSSNQIIWHDGTIETNSIALFQFTAEAGLVNSNQIVDIEITTNDETIDIISFSILDDSTGPNLSNPIPEDNG
jgi:hypothetical protein